MEERKHLIEKLRSTKGSRLKGSASESKIASSSSNVKPRWRKFEIGWLHFSEEKKIPRSKTVYWGWNEVNFVAWE